MSIMGRHVPMRVLAVAALLLVVVAGGALLTATGVWGPTPAGPVREIRLVVRDMAFYVESDLATPNPDIEVRAGERVRIVLANRERGMVHDFAVPALSAALEPVKWNETSESVIEIPARPGDFQYVCRPHEAMMRGTLRVVAP
jgi:plastocyanin